MRFRSVTAHAFGPLRNQKLELAEQMTVVVGDNESAKSTWHAAMFASLCGRRRSKGRPNAADQHFADLHKPWDADDWLVSAEISLDDGRNIEMRQDLAGNVDCHARDLQVGRDVSAEVIYDGTPDGARWLGLDRSTFVATACVGQAEMLAVLSGANGLQDALQRAATTAGVDATAAAALERLDAFQRERVGVDRSNAVKPLHRATEGVAIAKSRLTAAHLSHDQYLSRVEQLDQLRTAASSAAALVDAYEAAVAKRAADNMARRFTRSNELYAVYGENQPVSAAGNDALSHQVAEALGAWRSQPPEPAAPGRTSAAVQVDLDALPASPDGDTEVHSSVQSAVDCLGRAQAQLQLHDANRPQPMTYVVPPIAAQDEELLDLARTLETPPQVVPISTIERVEAARKSAAGARRTGPAARLMVGSGIAAVAAGAVLIVAASHVIGAVLLAIGTGLLVVGALRRGGRGPEAAAHDLAEAQAALSVAQQQASLSEERRTSAVLRCRSLGLGPDPAVLRRVPVERARSTAHEDDLGRWQQARSGLRDATATAADAIGAALAARGQPKPAPGEAEVGRAVEEYRQACRCRAFQAQEAARRGQLVTELAACRAAEERADQDRAKREQAARLVTDAAQACGVEGASPEECALALEGWSDRRGGALIDLSHAQEEWAELQALLGGQSLAELEGSARTAIERASELEAAVVPGLLMQVACDDPGAALPELREKARAADRLAEGAAGELVQFSAAIGSVPEAEEALEAAEAELSRVRELDETLRLTARFLEAAQGQVHRDIAPVLAQTLKRSLPVVTGGRYTDVSVDPTTLRVSVCGPLKHWRNAEHLSYGTAEQIYLLLRVALAEHLTKGHDTCPLILDDVTVHADSNRTHDVLELLLEVSQQRQVILFTQEEQVATWARTRLAPPNHAIRHLLPVTTV